MNQRVCGAVGGGKEEGVVWVFWAVYMDLGDGEEGS